VPGGLKVLIAVSKTIKHAVYVHVADRSDMFAVKQALLDLRDVNPEHLRGNDLLLFVKTDKNGPTTGKLTGSAFAKRIKKWVGELGLDPVDFSGHSLRRGGATALMLAGVPPHLIQLQGRWVSDCWKRYTEHSTAQLLAISAAI
jgi:integrase